MSRTTSGPWALGLVALLGAALGLALALPRCSDESLFLDAGSPDGPGWQYDGLGTSDWYINPCAPAAPPSVTGKVYAPNGIDPVAGASVHVALALLPLPSKVQCESCVAKGKFGALTYTAADGSFKLSGVPNGVPFKLGIQKGYFRRYLDLTVPKCGTLALTKAQSTLPGKNKQYGPFDSIPSIAVASGAWDKMEKVLDKLGVPADAITIYDGKTYSCGGTQCLQNLLQNAALMKSHHLVLINCGTQLESLVTSAGPARNTLREYVREGGRLFVTDFSYDYVEQVFPEFIDYEGSDGTATTEPEEHNAAEVGTEKIIVQATIQDPQLKAWLGLPEIKALAADGRVKIEGFMTGWAVQKAPSTTLGTKTWVSGPVTWVGGSGTRSLTTSFNFRDTDKKGCGRVVFSSYHTHGTATDLLPQERILEYLMLEIGTCMDIQ